MPAPKCTTPASAIYTTCALARYAAKETADCAVCAVVAATGRSYKEVHTVMASFGRKPRKGVNWGTITATLDFFGFNTMVVMRRPFIDRYPGVHKGLKTVTTHHPERFNAVWADGQTYLFDTGNHVLAVVNGVNHDWTRGKAKRVVCILQVVKKVS